MAKVVDKVASKADSNVVDAVKQAVDSKADRPDLEALRRLLADKADKSELDALLQVCVTLPCDKKTCPVWLFMAACKV